MTATGRAPRLLIVGNPDEIHVGAHFLSAAQALGIDARVCDVREAYDGPLLRRKVAWWLRGHRPVRLTSFGCHVVDVARQWKADHVLATGLAPLEASALSPLKRLGIRLLNYLTDDPWNPAHRSPWFLDALPHYDHVFSPREANLSELRAIGRPSVSYMPFAYAPAQHFVQTADTAEESHRYEADLIFAGGADPDRVQAITPFIDAGFKVALYGGYWDRYRHTRRFARGHVGPAELRKAISGARVCLGLVRHANRDGHSMRSFEVPAMGGCMLIEDTTEHRAIFGADGDAVVYFDSPVVAMDKLRGLLKQDDQRLRLATAAHALIHGAPHAYRDRLQAMLEVA